MRSGGLLLVLLSVLGTGCGFSSNDSSPPSTTFPDEFRSDLCEIRLHGRTEEGAEPRREDGFVVVTPDANESFDQGGRVWIYDSESDFEAASDQVEAALDVAGCQEAVLHGFSNGAAFAAKLVCSGEDFGGRLAGVVVDDPVVDDASPDCAPAEGVEVALYWTGSLPDDGSCSELGWTCAGSDELVGIDEYAARLGIEVQQSPESDHVIYEDPPEVRQWLGLA